MLFMVDMSPQTLKHKTPDHGRNETFLWCPGRGSIKADKKKKSCIAQGRMFSIALPHQGLWGFLGVYRGLKGLGFWVVA